MRRNLTGAIMARQRGSRRAASSPLGALRTVARRDVRARRRARPPRRSRAARRAPPPAATRPGARAPPRAASQPSARWAASAEECVQPEPCAAPSGWRSPGISTSRSPSKKTSIACSRWPPVTTTYARAERVDGAREGSSASPSLGRRPPAEQRRASGGSGVTTVARGSSRSTSARRASGVEQRARPTRRPSPGRARPACRRRAGRAPGRPPRSSPPSPSIPIFTASTPMSLGHGAHLRDDHLRRDGVHRVDRDRVLRGDRRDRRHPVHAARGERLQVGLDAGAAAGVRAGDREHARDGRRRVGHPRRRLPRRDRAATARRPARSSAEPLRGDAAASSSVARAPPWPRRRHVRRRPAPRRCRARRRRAPAARRSGRLEVGAIAGPAGRARAPAPNTQVQHVLRAADERARRRRAARSCPAASGDVTRPGTAPTSRPRSRGERGGDERARALARLDDDRRRGASAAMIRLRAGKAPAPRARARRQLGDDRAASRASCADAARACSPGTATSAPPAEHGDRRPAGLERARVGGGVDAQRHPADDRDARGREPAAERRAPPRARTADARRAPTIATAGRAVEQRSKPPGRPATCSTAGGVGEVARARPGSARRGGRPPRGRRGDAARAAVARRSRRGTRLDRARCAAPPSAAIRSSSAEREQRVAAGRRWPRDRDVARRAARAATAPQARAVRRQARVACGRPLMPPTASAALVAARSASAAGRRAARHASRPSRSAIVRATRRTRSWPRALRPPRS